MQTAEKRKIVLREKLFLGVGKGSGRKSLFRLLIVGALALGLAYGVNVSLAAGSAGIVYGAREVPAKPVALVLGAGVHGSTLSDMFRDRLDTALDLYRMGKAGKILVSGDHGRPDYDEVGAAKSYLLQKGVAGQDLFLDHAGFDTYDSLYRARDVFEVRALIVVTQGYHLPRALFIARALGLDAVGVAADRRVYGGQEYRDLREKLATVKAWLDVIFQVKPRYLGSPIPISGDGFASWG